jgi:hypothetical protein
MVALRLGRVPSRDTYKAERVKILQEHKRAWRSGQLTRADLPTADQVTGNLQTNWRGALELAGLVEPAPSGQKPGRARGRVGDEHWIRRGVPKVIYLEVILDHTGLLPNSHAFEAIPRELNLAVGEKGFTYGEAVKALREKRTQAGLATPPKSSRPEAPEFRFTDADKAAIRVEIARRLGIDEGDLFRTKRHRWSEADCVEALREFLRVLPPLAPPSQRTYSAMKLSRPEWPSQSRLRRYGTFLELLERARAANAAESSKGTDPRPSG